MIITEFIIYDFKHERGIRIPFVNGANIILSDDSKVGKSCLLKSIFYTFGLDVKKSFGNGWNYEEMLFKVKYLHNGQSGYIVRFIDRFYVDTEEKALNERGYSIWLLNLLGLNIKLPLKQVDGLTPPYASATLAPFYVDQDSSWKGIPYRNTVSSLQMYTAGAFPQKVFEGLFGISDDKIIEKEEEKARLSSEKKEIQNKINVLGSLRNSFIHQKVQSPAVNIQQIEKEIASWLKYTQSLRDKIEEYKRGIYKAQLTINTLELDKKEMLQVLKDTQNLFKHIEYRCSQCNSILTKEQSQQRLKLSCNEHSIALHIDSLEEEIQKQKKEIDKNTQFLDALENRYLEIKSMVEEKQEQLNFQNYVEANTEYLIKEKYIGISNQLWEDKGVLDGKLSAIEHELKDLKKKTQALKNTIETTFRTTLKDLMLNFPDIPLKNMKFLDFHTISDSGTQLNQVFFSVYIVYFHLLITYAKIQFTIGLDSPITSETSGINLEKMYTVIESYLFKASVQSLVVMLKDKLVYLKEKYHTIELTKPILQSSHIAEIRSEFQFIINNKIQ